MLPEYDDEENKSWIGMILVLLLPVIFAIIIGCYVYERDTYERKSYLKGLWLTYLVKIIVALIVSLIVLL